MMKKLLVIISRWITGLVFIFSGIVKGVDPLGTAYKLQDYFAAYNMEWADGLSLFLSISLCSLEFVVGTALIFNLWPKLTTRLLAVIMVFFTLLTFYDAIFAPVPDCGCFGDAIKLSNWQTFYKNLVLMIFVVLLLRQQYPRMKISQVKRHLLVLLIVAIAFVSFSWYNYQHLPMMDFRPWKIGNDMLGDQNAETKVFLTYRHKLSGEIKEYVSPNYPWNDSVWLANWEFVDQKFVSDAPLVAHNLRAEDMAGNDFTSALLGGNNMFLLISYDLHDISGGSLRHLQEFTKLLEKNKLEAAVITASLADDAEQFLLKNHLNLSVYFADETVLKTMIRSNPGLVLMHNGLVKGKWHHNDFPDEAALNILLQQTNEP